MRTIAPLVIALAMLAGTVHAQTTGPGNQCGDFFRGGHCLPGFPEVINVKDYGAKGDGTTDDRASIQAASNLLPTNGGAVYFPAGTYLVSGPIDLKAQSIYFGAGAGASTLQTQPTGTGGGYPIFEIATPRRCDGPAGVFNQATCEGLSGGGTRTGGCPCNTGTDCSSAVCGTAANASCTANGEPFSECCTGNNTGTSLGRCAASANQRRVVIAGLQFLVRENDGTGIDMCLFGESTIREVLVNETGGPTNTTGVLFCDNLSTIGNGFNELSNSFVSNTDVGVRVTGPTTRIRGNAFKTSTTGVIVDATTPASVIADNTFQGLAGGINLVDNGNDTIIDRNDFVLTSGTQISLASTSTRAEISRAVFSGAGTKYLINVAAVTPMIDDCLAASAPPVACAAGTTGICYFDIEQNEACICNGTAFTQKDGGGTTGCA